LDFVLLFILLVAAVLTVWWLVDKKSFTNTFLGKPEKRNTVQAAPVSTEVVRIHDHSRAGGGYESVGDINEPIQEAVEPVPRHEIIGHDYYRSYSGQMWPRWKCKCGASDYEPVTVYTSVHSAQRKARQAGQSHVINATMADENLRRTNGKFAF
jgi:hypothetical protein